MHVGRRALHCEAHAGLGREMHDVGEGDHVEELAEQRAVVDVAFHDEYAQIFELLLAGSLEGRLVVVVEVV